MDLVLKHLGIIPQDILKYCEFMQFNVSFYYVDKSISTQTLEFLPNDLLCLTKSVPHLLQSGFLS
uniref:Uncharacterized protein n=1 Tax=Rhizophora mucronata TaxID=61149 RepID=A0A2P2QC88_RHIMU